MTIIATTDTYDDDGIMSDVVKIGKRRNNGKWEYIVDCNGNETSYYDMITALRAYTDKVYSVCI